MKAQWLPIFLGFAYSFFSTVETTISPTEKKAKEAKWIKEEDNVLVLQKSNFDQALNETKYLLVEFCEYFKLLDPL